MDMLEALQLCKGGGHKARPVVWRTTNPGHWVEARAYGRRTVFAEYGEREEIPHALRLQDAEEFLGEWEAVE
jgi:hypothetical protein